MFCEKPFCDECILLNVRKLQSFASGFFSFPFATTGSEIRQCSVTVGFSYLGMGEHELGVNDTTATTLVGKIRLNGALAGKEEPLHSWVSRSNHELDGQQQQQVNLVPTAVYSNSVYNPRSNRHCNVIFNGM